MRSPSRSHPRPRPPAPRPEPNQEEAHLGGPELPAETTPPAEDARAAAPAPTRAADERVVEDLRDSDVLTRTVASAASADVERPRDAEAQTTASEAPEQAAGAAGMAEQAKEFVGQVREQVEHNEVVQGLVANVKGLADGVRQEVADVKAFVAAKLPEVAQGDGVVARLAAEIQARVAGDSDAVARAHILSLLKQFQDAMFVTHDIDGGIHARPMAVVDIDADGNVWFVTDRASTKAREITSDNDVSVLFQSPAVSVAISGRATLTTDRERVRQLWTEGWRLWFPDGPEETDLVLVRVETTRGEFWDRGGASRLRFLFDAARAYVKGERLPEPNGGMHGTASLG